ncbi:hypothetical protein VF14_23825 [Nostoc linckia z18]|uniref:Uncharacterized protein n=2 Tax=Nostoc linckia TaxID=92942 RepID=A0A9Q5Z8X4_NOSLI|nr:hypothetical protein VF02_20845 [Nostoc linckia z1]PHJ64835.1 hypothetical protein VF05_22050 [Nostoc linckia z3]PHJ76338.1 hypothetical protein VF03_07575 [Nostoc linckia z2]PHJ83212.1 hypothetical protein VF06_13950 [Nostoc linckia z4]PHJ90155.1 hypothetical protein VF07_09475 [Nostoc linckia z6]PHJ99694.1 hypothetical protein VF04_05830 [Nostoc linckia z7]PHK00388.1 hypothetical protein VF08_24350 [Nostoc linckia z8]PHK04776.1 hypothetical protein VF09_27925 [Nostoc linckia z9]PHK1818
MVKASFLVIALEKFPSKVFCSRFLIINLKFYIVVNQHITEVFLLEIHSIAKLTIFTFKLL